MNHIQIAIDDQSYAHEVAHLLEDAEHFVHVVDKASSAIDGVILADEAHFAALRPLQNDMNRYLVLANSPHSAASTVPGLCHFAFRSDPPFITCLAVLAAELRIANDKVSGVNGAN